MKFYQNQLPSAIVFEGEGVTVFNDGKVFIEKPLEEDVVSIEEFLEEDYISDEPWKFIWQPAFFKEPDGFFQKILRLFPSSSGAEGKMIRKIKKVVYFSTFTPLINVRHDLKFRQYVRLMQGFGRIDVEPKEFKRRAKRAAFLLYEALEQVPPGEIKQFLSEMLDDYVKQD